MRIRINRHSSAEQILICILSIALILIGGGCTSTFDYENYANHYSGEYSYLKLDPGFAFLQSSFSGLGVSYDNFRLAIIAAFVLTITIYGYKFAGRYVILIDILYLIFPFAFNLVNIRNTVACILIFIGFFSNIQIGGKKGLIYMIVCICSAALFHLSSLIYLFYVYIEIRQNFSVNTIRRKRYELLTMVICFTSLLLLSSKSVFSILVNTLLGIVSIVSPLVGKRMSYFNYSTRLGWIIFSLCHIGFTLSIARVRKEYYRKIKRQQCEIDIKTQHLLEIVYLGNIFMFAFFPLLRMSTELYRIYRGIAAIEYITYFTTRRRLNIRKWTLTRGDILLLITVMLNFIVQIYPYYGTIFITMFTMNRFF